MDRKMQTNAAASTKSRSLPTGWFYGDL